MRALPYLPVAILLTACQHVVGTGAAEVVRPESGGQLRVYLEALPEGAERLSFTVGSVTALGADGLTTPLQVAAPEVRGTVSRRQLLLAAGAVPPGGYRGLEVAIPAASLSGSAGPSALLVPKDPLRVDVPFAAEEGRATMVWIGLDVRASLRSAFELTPVLSARPPPALPVPQLVGYCSNAGSDDLSVFDRLTHDVFRATRTGRDPGALAVDRARRRLYVALAGEGEIQVVDSATAEKIDRIRLDPGDVPRDIALTTGGALLLSANEGSNSVSFVDPLRMQRLHRIPVGEDPSSVVVDALGVRAYVLNRRAGTISVLDVANRAVIGTIRTDPDPIRAALSRDGTRLYVMHRGSPFLVVRSVPDLAEVRRELLGRGTRALAVDPRTDLLYLGVAERPVVSVIDPLTMLAVSTVEVGGEPGSIVVDGQENRLMVLVPSRRAIVVVDLATLQPLGTIEVGADPQDFVLMGGS